MSFTATMSAAEKFQTQNVVDSFNKTLTANGRKTSNELGKDDFLKILIAQLSNQDPTSPLENTEFIAQMAQFSSLEQMTNMSQNFEKLAGMINSSEAQSLLGKTVELDAGDTSVTGQVQAATRGVQPQVFVNGMYYSMDKVKAVYGI
ncbi:MAG: flagellar hook assembly protein FlgD [Spirochaetia bacterium]|uniref:flagellar hook assembly protein FlgD n=1 Tax=uncultured Treponema sp. TaxID=162155 RepID=UPI0015BA1FFF|nr:flagellar hook assembly protein FlgD [uncultured Treponema sp.]MDD5790871.1 flagellar hook assembly protein FlgD [Spirochaetia bacterium]